MSGSYNDNSKEYSYDKGYQSYNPYPDFDIGKHLKGELPLDEVKQLFCVRVNGVKDIIKQDIIDLMEGYEIADIHIPWEIGSKTESGAPRLKGFAFVRFREEKDADKAVEEFDGKTLKDIPVTVERADESYVKPFQKFNSNYKGSNYDPNYQENRTKGYNNSKPRYAYPKESYYRPRGQGYSDPIPDERPYQSDYYTQHSAGPRPRYPRPNYSHYPEHYPQPRGPPQGRDSSNDYYQKRKFEHRGQPSYQSYERREYRQPRPYYPRPQRGSYGPPQQSYRAEGYENQYEGKRRKYSNYNNGRYPQENYSSGSRSYNAGSRDYSTGYNNAPQQQNSSRASGSGYERRNQNDYDASDRADKRY